LPSGDIVHMHFSISCGLERTTQTKNVFDSPQKQVNLLHHQGPTIDERFENFACPKPSVTTLSSTALITT
jgi:hypothetical protein